MGFAAGFNAGSSAVSDGLKTGMAIGGAINDRNRQAKLDADAEKKAQFSMAQKDRAIQDGMTLQFYEIMDKAYDPNEQQGRELITAPHDFMLKTRLGTDKNGYKYGTMAWVDENDRVIDDSFIANNPDAKPRLKITYFGEEKEGEIPENHVYMTPEEIRSQRRFYGAEIASKYGNAGKGSAITDGGGGSEVVDTSDPRYREQVAKTRSAELKAGEEELYATTPLATEKGVKEYYDTNIAPQMPKDGEDIPQSVLFQKNILSTIKTPKTFAREYKAKEEELSKLRKEYEEAPDDAWIRTDKIDIQKKISPLEQWIEFAHHIGRQAGYEFDENGRPISMLGKPIAVGEVADRPQGRALQAQDKSPTKNGATKQDYIARLEAAKTDEEYDAILEDARKNGVTLE